MKTTVYPNILKNDLKLGRTSLSPDVGAVRPAPTAAPATFVLPDLLARRLDLAIKINSLSIQKTYNLKIMLKRHDFASNNCRSVEYIGRTPVELV